MQINEYVLLLAIIFIGLIFVGSIINLVFTRRLLVHFKGQKVEIKARFQIEATTNERTFKMTLTNKNINDIKLIDFGIIYNKSEYSVYKSYMLEHDIDIDSKILIEPNENIEFMFNYTDLKQILLNVLNDRRKVKRIKIFATSKSGKESIKNAKDVRKNIVRKFKEELLIEKNEKKMIESEKRLELKKKKAEKARVNKNIRQEKRSQLRAKINNKGQKFIESVKNIFKKKKVEVKVQEQVKEKEKENEKEQKKESE